LTQEVDHVERHAGHRGDVVVVKRQCLNRGCDLGHAIRVKAGPKYLGRFKVMSVTDFSMAKQDLCIAKLLNDEREIKKIEKKFKHNAYYWISIGFDQMLHNLVHYYIIFAIIIDKAL